MSYDIRFKVQEKETNEWVDLLYHVANITWNVRDIICKSTGLEWNNEEDNGYVKDIIPKIEKGLLELTYHADYYKKYEPNNGWGTVSSVQEFFKDILKAWESLDFYYSKNLKNVAKFWIV